VPAPRELPQLLVSAGAYVISSPEYAHGIPGVLENGLDWLVSCAELTGKPVALRNASPAGGEFALRGLIEVLTTMSWPVLREACLLEPFLRKKLGPEVPFDGPALEAVGRALAASSSRDQLVHARE
jgi:NAD(P)H-dependent FMN reductase